MNIRITWDDRKRVDSIRKHGINSEAAATVFAGITFTFEDDRFNYRERRYVTLGLLNQSVVSIVHNETEYEIRIISFRKATQREAEIYFASFN